VVLISAIVVGIGGVRMLHIREFTQEVKDHVIDPEHTFEVEMATQINKLQPTYEGRKQSRGFLRELDRLHAQYHEQALHHGWLRPFNSPLPT
jgi:hypothetical protein